MQIVKDIRRNSAARSEPKRTLARHHNFSKSTGFASICLGSSWNSPVFRMTIRMSENGFEQPLRPSPVISAPREAGLWESLEQAIPIKEQLDRLRSWRLSPAMSRACSAAKLLFQFVGVAGYAGYFASMHIFMRVLSGTLMAGAWYAIYKIKGANRPQIVISEPPINQDSPSKSIST